MGKKNPFHFGLHILWFRGRQSFAYGTLCLPALLRGMSAVNPLMFFVTPAQSLERSSPWSILSLQSFMTSTPWELWQILLCVACIRLKHSPALLMSSVAVFRYTDWILLQWWILSASTLKAVNHLKNNFNSEHWFSGGVAVRPRIPTIHIRGGAIAAPMCPA
jgi:hypothetical protein